LGGLVKIIQLLVPRGKKKEKANIAHCSNATGSRIILIIEAKKKKVLAL